MKSSSRPWLISRGWQYHVVKHLKLWFLKMAVLIKLSDPFIMISQWFEHIPLNFILLANDFNNGRYSIIFVTHKVGIIGTVLWIWIKSLVTFCISNCFLYLFCISPKVENFLLISVSYLLLCLAFWYYFSLSGSLLYILLHYLLSRCYCFILF